MKNSVFVFIFLIITQVSLAQTLTPEQYIATYKDLAIKEMKRMGVPAAIKLAQGLLETDNGNSALVKKSNNHFGIKCKATWTGETTSHDDDAPQECFRVYKTSEDSYRDHSSFLRGSERYGFLFNLSPLDYRAWAYGLKKAGYATNNKYPEILIKNIEKYNLQQYSLLGASVVESPELIDVEAPSPEPAIKEEGAMENINANQKANVVYYEVQPKEGLYSIAKKHGVAISQLKKWNNLTEEALKIGQQLIVSQ